MKLDPYDIFFTLPYLGDYIYTYCISNITFLILHIEMLHFEWKWQKLLPESWILLEDIGLEMPQITGDDTMSLLIFLLKNLFYVLLLTSTFLGCRFGLEMPQIIGDDIM